MLKARARELRRMDATTPPYQPLLPSIPVCPRVNVEGNIVEHPIWVLTNRQARPMRPMVEKATGRVLIDPKTGKPQLYPDPADYTLSLDLGPAPDNATLRRQLIVTASVHHGFPTVFAFRVLVAVIERAHFHNYVSQKVAITPTEIIDSLGIEKRGGSTYRAVYDALNALESVQLCYIDTYYEITTKRVVPGRRTERIVKKSVFRARRDDAPVPPSPVLPGLGINEAMASQSSDNQDPEHPEDYVELGDGLWESLTGGYRFPIDREYLNALPNELTQRLYSYLAKKLGRDRGTWRESVKGVGRRLGLSKTKPADIRASLEPALAALARPGAPNGKVFLASYAFEGTRGEQQLVVLRHLGPEDEVVAYAGQKIRELRERLRASEQDRPAE